MGQPAAPLVTSATVKSEQLLVFSKCQTVRYTAGRLDALAYFVV